MTPEEIILEKEKPVWIVSGVDHMLRTPVGGPHEDAGLTGGNIIFDTYGGVNKLIKRGYSFNTVAEWEIAMTKTVLHGFRLRHRAQDPL